MVDCVIMSTCRRRGRREVRDETSGHLPRREWILGCRVSELAWMYHSGQDQGGGRSQHPRGHRGLGRGWPGGLEEGLADDRRAGAISGGFEGKEDRGHPLAEAL